MNLGNGRKVVRKENGVNYDWKRANSELRIPMSPLSYLDSEIAISTELQKMLEEELREDEK